MLFISRFSNRLKYSSCYLNCFSNQEMSPRLFQQIATKLNRDGRRHNGVTAEQVANVASGTERTVSHPIISQIRAELQHHAKKYGEHFLWSE